VLPMSSPLPGAPTICRQDHAHEVKRSHRTDSKDPITESHGQPAEECRPNGRRLLIVDDDVEMLTLVSRMAACLGCGTCSAANGTEALQLLQNGDVDLVITDYQMPLMDGFQLVSKIRRQSPGLPVILMTGYDSDELEDQIESQDLFDGLLKKPFNLNELREKISGAGTSLRESRPV
jgi:CheY-like chemotaxis protein